MGRSQETFSKKEKEKKKQQKKREKEEKREERQANNNKGKSLEDMLAYVDDDGNIVSTPPDPAKRKEIKIEDIPLGVPKQPEGNEEPAIRNGIVTFFNSSKGFGFIRDLKTQESIFVHVNGLIDPIKENARVTFETEMGHKGLNAVSVKLAK